MPTRELALRSRTSSERHAGTPPERKLLLETRRTVEARERADAGHLAATRADVGDAEDGRALGA